MTKYDTLLDPAFSALGDPTRRAIVSRLARGPATVSELAAAHDMALPSFLAHLRKLEAAGLIVTAKSGRVRTCRLAPGGLAPAQSWLREQQQVWEGRLDRFDDYVTDLIRERTDGPRPQD